MPPELTSSRPPSSDRAVVFAGDGPYARFALHAAAQIHDLTQGREFDLCLASDTLADAPPDSLSHLNLRRLGIDSGGMFDGLRLDPGRTDIVYLRLALPEALAGQYRRILYLDSDIFVQGGDFGALLDADMGGRPVAAVRDNTQWRTPGRRPEQFRRLGLPHAPYFNAGVLMIDVERWCDREIRARAVELGRAHREVMIRHDQNLLNAVLHGDWAEMHPTWNWQYTPSTDILAGFLSPHVLHFIGPHKPWSKTGGRIAPGIRHAFARFLARHFPDEPPLPDMPAPGRDRIRRSLWRHGLSLHRSLRHLDRFDTDLDLLT